MTVDWQQLKHKIETAETTENLLAVMYVLAVILIDERIAQKETPDLADRG